MKKLSFFLMAMLFSMMSFAAEATATISFADKAQRTVYTTSQQVWEQNGIVVTNDKASSTSNVGDYANPARFYKNSKVTIQCTLGNIKKIEISGWGDSKYNVWATSIGSEATESGSSVVITPTAVSDTYVANMTGGQARAGQMVVTYEVSDEGFVATPAIEGEPYFKESATVSMKAAEGLKVYYTLDGTDPTTASAEYAAPFEVTETTTVKAIAHDGENASDVVTVVFKKMEVLTPSEAAAITPTGDKYIVRGYVTSSNEYSTQYNNIDFFVADTKDGDEVLKVYRAVAVTEEDKAVKVGDYVEVIGVLAVYYETIQIAQGGTYTIIPEPAPEPVMFTVTATAENGTVEGAGEYAENAEATLTATAAEGYEFVNWTVDGAEVSTENPYTFVVTANVALVANFKAVVVEDPLPEGVPTQEELWASFQTAAGLSLGTLSEIAASTDPVPCKVICTPLTATEVQKAFANAEWAWLKNYIKEVQNAQKGNPVAASTVPELTDDLTSATWRYAIAAFFLQTQYAAWPYSADFTEAGKPQAWGPAYLAAQKPAEPATETVYFINAKKWAKVNVYAWTTDPNASWPGAAATKEAEQIAGYDVYSFTANAGQYANVIFNDGSSQTSDLVWTAGKYYVIDMGWLTKEEAEAELAAPLPETWNIVGDAGLMGKGWDLNAAENAMTLQADGTYLLEKKDITITAGNYEYKAAKDHGWTVAVPQDGNQKLTISKSGIYDITFVLNVTAKTLKATATLKKEAVVIPTVIIAGDMNGWDQNKDKFTMAADSLTATFKATLAVKNYGFKMIVGGAWHSDGKTITRAANSTKFTGANSSTNSTLKADIAGEYLFTWEYATKTLTVTYPALPVKYNVTVTAENGTVTGAGEYEEGTTATLTATAAEGYEFVNWTVGEEVVSTENPYSFVVTADVALVANFKEVEPAIEWIPMDLEITNLTTEVMEVEGAKYLLLQGRDDMNDADVMLFLNNYADVDDDYEVNAENSYMTFGGMELTVLEGVMTQTSETDKGTIYTGTVRASVEEEGMTMYVEFALTMYAAPATVIELTDAIVAINEELGTLTFNVPTGEGEGYMAELAGYTGPGVHEGPQICLFMTPEVVAYTNYAETSVADGVITLKGLFTSPMGPKFDVTISGKLPVEEPVEKPEPVYEENNLNPYAFGLESELSADKSTLTVIYRLNNSNATSVEVVVYNGTEVVATVPGTTTIGKNTVEVATAGLPGGVELTWGIVVKGTSVDAPTQEAKMYNMYCPHGLAIDKDPESEYFGRILVADAMNLVKDKTGYLGSGIGAGLHAFNPSFTTDSTVYTGGNDFTRILASNGYQPWRVKISEDGRIFVSSLDLNGVVVWEVSKDLQTWTPVISGTNDATDYNIYEDSTFIAGLNCSMDVTGSGENLKLLLYSTNNKGIGFNQSGYRLDEYALGTATTWTGAPKNILEGGKLGLVHTNVEFIYDGEGGYWFGGSRAGNAGQPNLVHINAEGVEDYRNEDASLYGGDGVLVHNGMLFKGKARSSNTVGNFGVWTIGKDAEGNTTLTEKWSVSANGIGRNLNEFAVDYAENLYVVGNSGEKIIAYALPYSGEVTTPAAAKYAFELEAALAPVEMVGVVKRAVQNGQEVIVLTHEADGAAHIYRVVDGKAVAEISQEGVVPVDPENKGSYLAISDIAVTEDGKLVANNYVRNQFAGTTPEAGYKVGTSYYYIWNDLAGAPAVWFTSQTTARSSHGDVGVTFALKGTSTNAELLVTAVHNNNRAVRLAKYNIIDGQYVEPNIPGGEQSNAHYEYFGLHTTAAYYQEAVQGKQFQLNVSPLGEGRWIMDGELVNPSEFVLPAVGEAYEASAVLTEDLGNVYNGASYVTVGEKVLMVAPFANPDGQLVGVEILNITNGFDAPQYVDMVYVDEAVAATAAATAVEVVEGGLNITLVADNAIHTWFVEMSEGPEYVRYEDEITNLVIDLDNLVLIGGPSSAFQVDVYLGLGEYNRNDDTYQLLPESSIAVMGSDATFIDGYAYEVDAFTPSAKAVVHCEWNGMLLEFHLTMTAAPLEATVVVVENATVEIEKYLLWGDMYDYALKMTGEWVNPENGLTYPVLVEVPVYYPEATEPSEIMSTVTVGGWGDNDPWLGFGEGTLTITTVDGVVTATGIVQNPMAGVAIDITISGKLPSDEPVKYTVTATVNPVEAGTVEGAGEYEENTEATLIATAAEGYEFVNWTVAGEEVSTDATYTFTVTADVEVVANFKETVGSGVNNIQTGVKAVKTIKNGQLIITKDGKEYNAQGAQL